MKNLIVIFMTLALLTTSGCLWTTRESSQGGTAPVDEEFSITVPSSDTLKQGEEKTITFTLNRGADFKRDVQLEIQADGISIIPRTVLVRASDKPDVQIRIKAYTSTALGEYRVSVKGTPSIGKSTSAVFTVEVVTQ